jgi:transcriptional regulator with XRE-family HTH domain
MRDNETAMNEWRRSIIKRIAQARNANGLTQTQLADILHTHRSNISRLESGGHNPSLDFLLRVAATLDMELDIKPLRMGSFIMENIYELRLYDQILMTFAFETRASKAWSRKFSPLLRPKSASSRLI